MNAMQSEVVEAFRAIDVPGHEVPQASAASLSAFAQDDVTASQSDVGAPTIDTVTLQGGPARHRCTLGVLPH